jgi:DNA-binding MarR family transcriptional regulator
MTTTAPTLNGQILGEAERATAALLERLLAGIGTTFYEWVALNQTTLSGGTIDHDDLVAKMVSGLKIDQATVLDAVAQLHSSGLLEVWQDNGSAVTLTDAGRARHQQIRAAIGEISGRLYAGLPADDLATAGRVLTTLTARANAELARSGA